MRISDWSSDVCSSDLVEADRLAIGHRVLDDRPHQLRIFLGLAEAARVRNLRPEAVLDRKSVVEGKSVSVRVDLGGRRIIKKKIINITIDTIVRPFFLILT